MPTNRKITFANDYFYHVFNRGVDKRVIFQDRRDYERFYRALFLLNNVHYTATSGRIFTLAQKDLLSLSTQLRKPLVHIVSFCLRPTHFHLLLQQRLDDGIPKFLQRLLGSYSLYFNKKHERVGRLFEGPFRAVFVERDAHLEHLPRYIHLNALDDSDPRWREGLIDDWRKAEALLDAYPWSSHAFYCGKPQALPIVESSLVTPMFETVEAYRSFLALWGTRAVEEVQLMTPW